MIKKFILIVAILSLVACATIVSKSQWPVNISSRPDGANFTISNVYGQTVYSGTTPTKVILNSSDRYFKKALYTIKYEKTGYETKIYQLTPTVNGWYFGNLLMVSAGIVFGMLIIDPLTGAMYRLPNDVNISLDADKHSNNNQLRILPISELSARQKEKLIRLN
jgi:hypothetical protein